MGYSEVGKLDLCEASLHGTHCLPIPRTVGNFDTI